MKSWGWGILFCGCVLSASASDLSGSLTALGGLEDSRGLASASLFRLRLGGDWQKQWSPAWTASVGLLGSWTGIGSPYAAISSDDGEADLLDAEYQKTTDDGRSLVSLRLQKACVGFEQGRWQGSAGRVVLSWGEAHVVRPTCVFHAPRVLETFGDPVVGSDGVDLSYAVGANTNLEGAVRFMRGGRAEFVVRVENRGIGVSGTPLFAKREGEDGLGAELSATLKHFQWRLEGMGWHEEGASGRRMEFVTGIYGAFQKFPVGVEFVRDGTGRLLGAGVDTPDKGDNYISMFAETPNIYRFRCSPSLLKSVQGGRWMARPTLTYEFSKRFQMGLDGRWVIGSASGPLAAVPTQWWLSTTVSL